MREQSNLLSRTEAVCLAGIGFGSNTADELSALSSANDVKKENIATRWYTVEQFERDYVIKILEKLEQGDLDDEIWGKIILMEKCKRLAEAYLRRTTLIIDGSNDEYDGITLGFNHFQNDDFDKASNQIRHKIGDGVIIKVDENGNVKAMARGLTPIIVQGWNNPMSKCISEQLVAQKGHLKTLKDRLKGITDQQRVEKIFDMRLFNLAIEHELNRPMPSISTLFLKTCIRVALVKDVTTNALKTPCWVMIVNLVALDVLRAKLSFLINNHSAPSTTQSNTVLNEILPSLYTEQMLIKRSHELSGSLPALHQIQQSKQPRIRREKIPSSPSSVQPSDFEDTTVEYRSMKNDKKEQYSQAKDLTLSSESSSGVSSMDLMKNFEKVESWCKNSSKFLEEDAQGDDFDGDEFDNIAGTEISSSVDLPNARGHVQEKSKEECQKALEHREIEEDGLQTNNRSERQNFVSFRRITEHPQLIQPRCETFNGNHNLCDWKSASRDILHETTDSLQKSFCISEKDIRNADLKASALQNPLKNAEHSGRITNKESVNENCIHAKEILSANQYYYNDGSPGVGAYYPERHHLGIHGDPQDYCQGSQDYQVQNYPVRNDAVNDVPTIPMGYHDQYKMLESANMNIANFQNNYSEWCSRHHDKTIGKNQYPHTAEKDNGKKNCWKKKSLSASEKLTKSINSGLNMRHGLMRLTDLQQTQRHLEIPEAKYAVTQQPRLNRFAPSLYSVPMVDRMHQQKQKEAISKKLLEIEPCNASEIFINPIYEASESSSTKKRNEFKIPISNESSIDDTFRENKKITRIILPYGDVALMTPCPAVGSGRHSARAFRRFI